jgi:hypothetical protein
MQIEKHNSTDVSVLDRLSLVLRKPVTFAGKEHTAVELREPDAGELEAASNAKSGVGSLMKLISIVAGVPMGVAEGMCSRDLAQADAFFNTFSVPPVDVAEGDDFVDETTITLRKPVSLGKGDAAVQHTQLTLQEPTGGQKDKAAREPNDTRAAIVLISLVAKVPRLVVERMCRRDFEEACNFLASCNVVGQTTGATSARS